MHISKIIFNFVLATALIIVKMTYSILHRVGIIFLTLILGAIGCTEHEGQEQTPPTIIPNPEPEPEAESYTIMYYACGGGSLDNGISIVIRSAEVFGCGPNVNITGSVKWTKSRDNNINNGEGGVHRFVLSDKQRELEMEQIGDEYYPIHTSENIADFIMWSKSTAPADNYILVLAGHGNGWHPGVGILETRGTVRDTDLDHYIGLDELSMGIELSDTHFKMISFNSCLMNTMEYLTGLSDKADYILAPSHVSILLGSELAFLAMSLDEQEEGGDEAFVNAMDIYIKDMAEQMQLYGEEDSALDLTLTDTRKIAPINEAIRRLTSIIVAIYDEEQAVGAETMVERYGGTVKDIEERLKGAYNFLESHLTDEEINETEYMRQSFTFDLIDIATRMSSALTLPILDGVVNDLRSAVDDARALHYVQGLEGMEDVYYAITLTNRKNWDEYRYERAGYRETLFDRTTGWSRFLIRNNIEMKY